ncbi:MAG: hypothetical protein AB1671_08000 [Thermodesulfobacteriota bacterium]
MRSGAWDRFMIVLMSITIFFCLQELWQSPTPLSETRYLVAIGLAALVIVLKVNAIRRASRTGR